MSDSGDTVTLISILGSDYSIKTSAAQQAVLLAAAQMLQALLAATKAKAPGLLGEKLLVLAALELCSQHAELQQRQLDVQRVETKVRTRIDALASLIQSV
jgi:cell division protein ZapA